MTTLAYRAGTAFLQITPSFKDLHLKIATEVKRIPAAVIKVDADTMRATGKIDALSRPLSTVLNVDADTGAARGKLDVLTRPRKASVNADADTSAAALKMDAVSRSRSSTINVDADTGRARAAIAALSGGSILLNVAIAAAPLAIAAAPILAGAAAGLAGIGAGALAGVAGGAALGTASIKQALDLQKQLTTASKTRVTALAGVRSAESSLRSAVASSATAQIAAQRGVVDAERGVQDAQRGVADAERGVQDARRQAAQAAVQSARQVATAQQQIVAAQGRVIQSLAALHQAQEQRKRDLQDMRNSSKDNKLGIEGDKISLIDARNNLAALTKQEQARIATVNQLRAALATAQPGSAQALSLQAQLTKAEQSGSGSALNLRKARLDVAEAEQQLTEARLASKRSATDLVKAEKDPNSLGVGSAKGQVKDARTQLGQARTQLGQARQDAAATRAAGERSIATAQRGVANAQRALATAEQNLSRARTDGARQVAQAQARVADAQKRVAAANAKVDAADSGRAKILGEMTPSMKKTVAAIGALRGEWTKLVGMPAIGGAVLAGIGALQKALPALKPFIRPVMGALKDVLTSFGNAAGTKGFRQFAGDFGRFSAAILRDGGKGILNLAHGFGTLLQAFFPTSKGMSKGILGLTQDFSKWADRWVKSAGFKGFVGFLHKEGPPFMKLLGDIVGVAFKIGAALAPLGGLMLKGLEKVFGWLSKLSPQQLILIAGGIAAIGVAIAIAFDANPVGLIVTAIVALAGAFAYAYKHSETFRKGVDLVFKFIKDHWALIVPLLAGPLGLAVVLIIKHWTTVQKVIVFTWNNIIKPTLKALVWFFQNVLAPTVAWLWTHVVKPAFKAIGANIAFTWNNVVKPIFKALVWFFNNVLGPVFTWLWKKVVKPAFDGLGAAIKWTWQNVVKPVFDTIKSAVGKVGDAFSKVVGGIKTIWGKLKDAVKKPIAFIINTVYNKGIVPFVNRIPFIPGTLHTIPGFDVGGYTGRGGKYEPAGIVHRNEHVIRSESTDSLNRRAPGFLDHLNKRGADALKGLLPGYSQGGGVGGGGLYRPTAHGSYGGLQREGGFNAVDIGVPQGTPIHAAASGRVTISRDLRGNEPRNTKQNGFYSYGRYIQIHHSRGNTIYAHMVRRLAGRGTMVRGGEVIGYSGHTGHTLGRTGDHLHFGANGLPSVYTYLNASTNYSGRGTAPGTTGGGGGSIGYGGPSVKDARAALNPGEWLHALKAMGPWGGALGGMVGGVVGKLKNVVVGKIKDAVSAANNFMFGSAMRFDASSRGVWKALRAAGWNQAAAAGMMGNMQVESGFSPTIIEGGTHGTPGQAGSRGYGLVQWTPASKIARLLGGRAPTVGNEVAALTRELRGGYGGLVSQLQRSSSPVAAAMAFLHGYERPRNPNQPIRGVYATTWFNRFARKPALHDTGGYIPPGLSQVYNGTRKPEAVFNAKQWADIHTLATRGAGASRGGPLVHIEHLEARDEKAAAMAMRAEAMKINALMRPLA